MLTQKPISGVYKITNTITNEAYIGCSTNIRKRWYAHRSRYKTKDNNEYDKKLYRSMREYGLENFKIEILEEADPSIIHERERYYIKTFSTEQNGLNDTARHDRHGRARLSMTDVIDIRERHAANESKQSVYADYNEKISKRGFDKIWCGYTWTDVKPGIQKENAKPDVSYKGSPLKVNRREKLTSEDVCEMRKMRKSGTKPATAYKKFKDKIEFEGFKDAWYGRSWKDIA